MQQLHKKQYRYNLDKDALLMTGRDICFQDIIDIITSGNTLGVKKHPNTEKYPNQYLIYVPLNGDVYVVPCVKESEDCIFLKTAYPSSKARDYFFPDKKKKK
jgi:hypothetical protein